MRSVVPLALAVTLVAGGCAAGQGERQPHDSRSDLAAALTGYVPGKTTTCIDPQLSEGPQVIGKSTLIYRQGATLYRNDLAAPCRSLDPTATIITEIRGGELCRNDMFRTREPGETIPSPFCRLGDFTEYDPIRK